MTPRELSETHLQRAEERAEDAGGTIGFAQVAIEGDLAELFKLFVAPTRLRTGAGRALFDWATETARAEGARRMTIEADPEAAPFYRRMGRPRHRHGAVRLDPRPRAAAVGAGALGGIGPEGGVGPGTYSY